MMHGQKNIKLFIYVIANVNKTFRTLFICL